MKNKVTAIKKGDGQLIYVDRNGNMYYDFDLKQPIKNELQESMIFMDMKFIL